MTSLEKWLPLSDLDRGFLIYYPMKYYSITLFLLGSTFLFAQTNTAVLYLNDTSTNGIQATGNTANGQYSFAIGH